MKDFRSRIEELFDEAKDRNYNCTRAEFAKQCGISTGQLSGYLQGNGIGFCKILGEIARRKNVSVAWLIGVSNNRLGEEIPLKEMLENLDAQELYAVQVFIEFIHEKKEFLKKSKKASKK